MTSLAIPRLKQYPQSSKLTAFNTHTFLSHLQGVFIITLCWDLEIQIAVQASGTKVYRCYEFIRNTSFMCSGLSPGKC